MKRSILFTILFSAAVILANCNFAYSQSRANRLIRPCPATATPATVEIQRDGDIDLIPCAGRDILLNGSALSNGFTVSGASRTNYFPFFSTQTNLAKSPFSWDATLYTFDNTAEDSEFTMELTPSTAAGLFRVGDFTTTPATRFILDRSADSALLSAGTVEIGEASSLTTLRGSIIVLGQSAFGNSTLTVSDGGNGSFTFADANLDSTVNFSGVINFQYLRTVTAGGTTGNQTINKPVGSVNFAAAADEITVTNSVALTTSLIFATAQTDDATCTSFNVDSKLSGSFVIKANAACTAETQVAFFVTN